MFRITFRNPWVVQAYDRTFIGLTPIEAIDAATEYGEREQLRAVSLTASRIIAPLTTVPGHARVC